MPFCQRKCRYCDFNSHAYRDQDLLAHVDAILREAECRAAKLRPQTVFLGGGTPTLLGAAGLARLLEGLDRICDFRTHALEVTMEANPESLSAEVAQAARAGGVDRLSIGIQSFDDEILAAYDRVHDGDTARRAYDIARAAGFERINLDLIYAFPGQDPEAWRKTLEEVHHMGPEHLSCYELSYEPGTPLTRLREAGRWRAEDPDRCAALFHLTREMNRAAGYLPYEVSAFARAGEACLHNLGYWRGLDYVGIGAGAASWRRACRRSNLARPQDYEQALRAGRDPLAEEERPNAQLRLFDHLMMGLRLEQEGVLWERARRQSSAEAADALLPQLDALVAAGELTWEESDSGRRLRATPSAYPKLDSLLTGLLPESDVAEL